MPKRQLEEKKSNGNANESELLLCDYQRQRTGTMTTFFAWYKI
jgi:hypothetical protein